MVGGAHPTGAVATEFDAGSEIVETGVADEAGASGVGTVDVARRDFDWVPGAWPFPLSTIEWASGPVSARPEDSAADEWLVALDPLPLA